MRTKLIVAIPLLLLVAAVAALVFAGEEPGSLPEVGGRNLSAHQGDAGVGSGSREVGDLPAGQPSPEEAPAPAIERREVASSESGEAPRIVISGRLVDAEGQPLAGTELAVRLFDPGSLMVGMETEDLRSLFGGADPKKGLPSTRSDDAGLFSFRIRPGRPGRVLLTGDERLFGRKTGSFGAAQGDTDLGDLVAHLPASVSGVVIDQIGRPLEGVQVRAGQAGGWGIGLGPRRQAGTTDTEGRFSITGLRPGPSGLRTASSSHLPGEVQIELVSGEQKTGVRIELEPGLVVAGQVVDDLGRPVADAKVGAQRKRSNAGVTIRSFSPDEATTTDSNGFFVLGGLEGETCLVRAWADGHVADVLRSVQIGRQDLLLRLHRRATITGTLVDGTGRPIAGSRVRVNRSANRPGIFSMEEAPVMDGRGRSRAVTDAEGHFALENVPAGTVNVVATGQHRPARVRGLVVPPGGTITGVRMVVQLGATLRVAVTDPAGDPVEGARLKVERHKNSQGGHRMVRSMRFESEDGEVREYGSSLGSATTDEDGVAEIAGLPAGPVDIEAAHDVFAPSHVQFLTLPAAGAVEASLALRAGGAVQVLTIDERGVPVGGSELLLLGPSGGGEERHRKATDASGEVLVSNLLPGAYTAEIVLPRQASSVGGNAFLMLGDRSLTRLAQTRVDFQIIAGDTIPLRLVKPVLTTLSGRVLDAEGGVAGAQISLTNLGEEEEEIVSVIRSGPRATSDATGRYSIPDLPSGRYAVRFGRRGQVVDAREEILVPVGVPELDRNLQLLGGVLKITAFSKDTGEPIEGAEVRIERAGIAGAPQQRRVYMVAIMTNDDSGGGSTINVGTPTVRTDVDGVAVIEDVPAGEYDVILSHGKHVEKTVAQQWVQDQRTTDAGVVHLEPAGRVTINVVDAAGNAVEGMVRIEYRPESEANWDTEIGANGKRLSGLAPGVWFVRASTVGDSGLGSQGPEVRLEIKKGGNPPAQVTAGN